MSLYSSRYKFQTSWFMGLAAAFTEAFYLWRNFWQSAWGFENWPICFIPILVHLCSKVMFFFPHFLKLFMWYWAWYLIITNDDPKTMAWADIVSLVFVQIFFLYVFYHAMVSIELLISLDVWISKRHWPSHIFFFCFIRMLESSF